MPAPPGRTGHLCSLLMTTSASQCGGFSGEEKWQGATHFPPTHPALLSPHPVQCFVGAVFGSCDKHEHIRGSAASQTHYPSSFVITLIFWISSMSEHLNLCKMRSFSQIQCERQLKQRIYTCTRQFSSK